MPRWCTCDKIETCTLCKLYHTSPKHRAYWDRPEATPKAERGLGDDVAAVAKMVGAAKLAKVVEAVTGRKCGCGEHRAKLNQLPSVRTMARRLAGK